MRNIPISQPATGEEEWLATRPCFESGWLTQGPMVAEFEKNFAQKHCVKHAIAVTSCTTGLHLALLSLGVKPGDEVIVPAFTWVATANVVLYCGATPIFVDIDPDTYNLDLSQISGKLSQKTKAIIPVHLFGLCVNVSKLRELIPPNVVVIEDAACAVGATCDGRYAGGLGDAGVFSFHPRKILTTGEGGMVTTNNDRIAELINQMRNHGASISEEQRHLGPRPYLLPEFNLLGYNYRMTDLQGAVGVKQLEKMDRLINERKKWADYYQKALEPIEWLKTPKVPPSLEHSWQAYVCLVDSCRSPLTRNEIMDQLHQRGISTRPGTHSVPMLNYYQKRFGYRKDDFPQASACENQTLALPLHNRMTKEDFEFIIESIHAIDQQRCQASCVE